MSIRNGVSEGSPFRLIKSNNMINTCDSTRRINSFQFVAIPSPRDVFARYGERLSSRGEYSSTGEQVEPAMVSATSVIDQLINATNYLEKSVDNGTK